MEYRWLLLLHQIPPDPLYFRAKILRRIKQLGALALKKSAYLLPWGEDAVEDFEWLRREIEAGGGEAWVIEGQFLAGLTAAEVIEQFQAARAADYAELAQEVRGGGKPGRLRKRLAEIRAIDFFGAPGGDEVTRMIEEMDQPAAGASPHGGMPQNAVWVTRLGVKVDRMSSAWLIRRYLDRGARFRFVDPASYEHRPGEVRFDMFEGEFTHRDNRCTFEVLLETAGLESRGLRAVAEIVHDLDIKDEKYQRPETAGVAAVLAGIMKRYPDDAARVERAAEFFETLAAELDR